ncbi:MAG: ATP-dependent sacrificial sulfur transferase LarE [Planctomycetes bacterium]|nr:ATP-dependent sacrificial sulfur transferase LarE [Planctomycetota bacterium]
MSLPLAPTTAEKLLRLRARLAELPSALVAFSGGTDSAFLVAVAREALGERAVAVTADSESLPAVELEDARRVAAAIGARHLVLPTREVGRPEYRANRGDRCYHCKTELFEVLGDLARREGFAAVLYGGNADDLADFRPGHRAAEEHGALAPLAEVGFTKREVREASRAMGLPTWDKPASACLASRVPPGTPVTPELLARIEEGEDELRRLGFRQFRLRHHGEIARVELGEEEIERAAAPGVRERIVAAIEDRGWRFVTLDLAGYRSGSLNP